MAAVDSTTILAAIVESSDDAIISKDLNGIVMSWNPSAERIFGFTRDEMVGTSIRRIIPADRLSEEDFIISEIRQGRRVRHFETVRITKDGRRIDVSLTTSPVRDKNGQIIGASKIARDITAQRELREAHRLAEQQYRTLFEAAPHGILIADARGVYTDVNPSMCRMIGWGRDDLVGRDATAIVAPAEVQYIAPALASIAEGDYHREWQFRRKDGTGFSGEVAVTKLPDGRVLAIVRDVEDRNRALGALREAEERMRFALENANVGIWDRDFVKDDLTLSPIVEAHYGYAPGTFPRSFDALISSVHPEDRAPLLAAAQEALASGSEFTLRHRAVWPDGKVRWLTAIGKVFLDADGQPRRAVGISLDVTDRQLLEDQFQRSQKLEALGRLAGGVAHDFNNLLTAILGYCELVRSSLDPNDERRADMDQIRMAGDSAAALTRQLLAFSRQEIIQPSRLDLNTIVHDMQRMLGRVIGEDVKVAVALGDEPAMVNADRGQLEQVIMNLAVNGRDAMPNGGVLTIESAVVELDDHYARTHFNLKPGRYVRLTVGDTGTGMTAEVQSRIFEPFFTTKSQGKGTGLGLSSVYGIVSRYGGIVNVYSEVGRGSTFSAYFPLADGSDAASRRPRSEVAPVPIAATVLVVEDAAGVRDLVCRLLASRGYTVIAAGNAAEATEQFQAYPHVDLLLTDIVMPGGTGPELSAALTRQRPALKTLFMSGYTDEAIVHQGVLEPGVAFLHKPFTADALDNKIRDVLGAGNRLP